MPIFGGKNSLPDRENELVVLQNGTDFPVLVFYFLGSSLAIRIATNSFLIAVIYHRPKYIFLSFS